MKELLKQIAINNEIKIDLSRYVTINFAYLDGGKIELCVDNHGLFKNGKETLILDNSISNKNEILQKFCEIEEVQQFIENKNNEVENYAQLSQESVNEILGFLQWEQKVEAEDEYYLTKMLELVQNGSTIQIDKGKLLRFAYTEFGTEFQILNFEKANDGIAVEFEEHTPNEVAEILAKSYAKNKEVLNPKIDEQAEKTTKKNEEIKQRMNILFKNFGVEQTESFEQNM